MAMAKVVAVNQHAGVARFRILRGPHRGEVLVTRWDPAEGPQPFSVGDIVDLERKPN